MSSRRTSFANIEASKSTWTFLALKYSLVVTLAVNLINLMATLPIGLAAIEDSEDTHEEDLNFSKETAKYIFAGHLGVNVLIVFFSIIGVTKQHFRLLIIVTTLMTFQSISSCLIIVLTRAIFVAIAINIIITVMIGTFTYMCRDRNLELDGDSDAKEESL